MGIGAQSPFWKRFLYQLFASKYFRRTCKTEYGIFEAFVSPSSSLKVLDFRQPLVEPVHARFIREWVQTNSVIWDIGGNLGLFAFPAALKAADGRVYVIEPDLDLAANLCRSTQLPKNRKLQMTVLCLAVANDIGVATFEISKFSRAMNKLQAFGKWNESQVVAKELRTVPVMSIDTLARTLEPPAILKVDVEGAEVEVLKGGEATISAFRPVILIEGPSELEAPMRDFFELHRYVLLDGEAERPSPLSHPVWNTIAVPAERYAN